MRALGERIGLYRVAAILIGCALVLEIVRVQVLPGSTVATIACTLGEVVFVAAAAGVFVIARREARPRLIVGESSDGQGIRRRPGGRGGRAAARGARRRAARRPRPRSAPAVYGSTEDEPERHFLGWLGEVDPDELFASGAAYGITVVRRAAGGTTRRDPGSRLKPVTAPWPTPTRYLSA